MHLKVWNFLYNIKKRNCVKTAAPKSSASMPATSNFWDGTRSHLGRLGLKPSCLISWSHCIQAVQLQDIEAEMFQSSTYWRIEIPWALGNAPPNLTSRENRYDEVAKPKISAGKWKGRRSNWKFMHFLWFRTMGIWKTVSYRSKTVDQVPGSIKLMIDDVVSTRKRGDTIQISWGCLGLSLASTHPSSWGSGRFDCKKKTDLEMSLPR